MLLRALSNQANLSPLQAPAQNTAAAPTGNVEFSYDPQDQTVMSPTTVVISGVKSGPSTDKIQLKQSLTPSENGNYVYDPDQDPQSWVAANTFASVASTINTFEKALGQPIHWSFGNSKLGITPDNGNDFNAYYSKNDKGLFFFHGTDPATHKTVYSGASGEVVGHETGHAMLDSLRPGYFQAWSPDPAAFHESFGDVIAMLSTLKNDAVLDKVVQQTRGDLSKQNIAAALGEELGSAINHKVGKNVTGGNWTRNAINDFTWQDPSTLPNSGPPDQLTPEAHNFSRLWTGAMYDVLKGITDENLQAGQSPKNAIKNAADEMLGMYARTFKTTAPEGDFTYADMAKAFIDAEDQTDGGKHSDLLRQVFTDRKILDGRESLVDQPLPQGTHTVTTTLNGPAYGKFQGAQVQSLASGANRNIFQAAEEQTKLQNDMARLIQSGRIKWTEPNQVVTTKDLFDANGHPYTGVVRWVDGHMAIERVPVAD